MTSRNEILTHEEKIINKLTERINFLNKKSNSLSYYRLTTIIAGVALAFVAFNYIDSLVAWIVIVLDLSLFAVLAARQSKVIQSIEKAKKWINIKSVRIAKMNLNWEKIPEIKKEYRDSHHPFEIDLDITGQYSLLRILNNTFSKEGFDKLKFWLLNASLSTVLGELQ